MSRRFETLWREIRDGIRRLIRDWRFSVPAIFVLGLGVGANTAIFSLVNAALIRGPSYASSSRLVDIYLMSLLAIVALRTSAAPAPGVSLYRPSADPLMLFSIAAFMGALGLLAAFMPAWRAAGLDPMTALRRD